MRITPIEIKSHQIRKSLRGYDVREVDALRDLAADALESAAKDISSLEEKLRDTEVRLEDHIANERMLKDTITTAQRMVDDIKGNARKESELIIAEAKLQAEEIVRQAQDRAREIHDEIFRLKKQRIEMETSIKALIDYHSARLVLEEDESKKSEAEADKLRFFPKG